MTVGDLGIDSLNIERLALGLVAGVILVAATTRPDLRRTVPLLAAAGIALLSPELEMTWPIAAAAAVASVASGWGTRQLSRSNRSSVLALYGLMTLIGMWATVPDTEAVLVALGVLLPLSVVAFVRYPTINDLIGWPLLALTVVVIAAASSAEQLDIAIAAFGCFGLLVVVPLVGLIDRRAIALVDPATGPLSALFAGVVGVGVVIVCSRLATRADTTLQTLYVVGACWIVAACLLLIATRFVRPRSPMP